MTSASLQPWTDKDTQMPRIDTLPLIQSYSCCANAETILTALEERNRERRRNGSVVFEGGGLPYQLNRSWDRQRCVGNSENQKRFYLLLFSRLHCEADSQRKILWLGGCSFRRLRSSQLRFIKVLIEGQILVPRGLWANILGYQKVKIYELVFIFIHMKITFMCSGRNQLEVP